MFRVPASIPWDRFAPVHLLPPIYQSTEVRINNFGIQIFVELLSVDYLYPARQRRVESFYIDEWCSWFVQSWISMDNPSAQTHSSPVLQGAEISALGTQFSIGSVLDRKEIVCHKFYRYAQVNEFWVLEWGIISSSGGKWFRVYLSVLCYIGSEFTADFWCWETCL